MSSVQKSFNKAINTNDLEALLDTAKKVCSYNIKTRNIQLPPFMDREDIIQEVLFKVYKAFDKFDNSKSSANTYFNRVIDRVIIDCIRKVSTMQKYVSNSALDYTSNEYLDNVLYADQSNEKSTLVQKYCNNTLNTSTGVVEVKELLIDLQNVLTDRQRSILKLRYSGYTFHDIAKKLGVSCPTVQNDWKLIKQQVKLLI